MTRSKKYKSVVDVGRVWVQECDRFWDPELGLPAKRPEQSRQNQPQQHESKDKPSRQDFTGL